MLKRPLFVLAFLLIFLPMSTAAAQRCYDELSAGRSANDLALPVDGRGAARLLKRAVELLEPSLPPLVRVVDLPVPADDPDRETFSYLADRELLAPQWSAGAFSYDAWTFALTKIAGWYELPAPELTDTTPSTIDLMTSLEPVFEAAGPYLDPVAVFAFDPADPSRVQFWATLRNGVYPRLVVVRPPDEPVNVQDDVRGAMARLSDCVVDVRNYVYAPADTAEQLFIATNESRMVILATEPASEQYLLEAPTGTEASYLTFQAPEVADKVRYTALFLGPSVGFGTLLRLIPQLRTNMSPQAILRFLNG